MRIPDAVPQIEPIQTGGPNKPYQVAGRTYTPVTADVPMEERGMASWYGRKYHGRRTSSGEPYNMFSMSAAHPTMPLPSYARVRNPANGREIIVKVNDRGPFASDRILDLSWAAASKLGIANRISPVEVRRLTHDDIEAYSGVRSGSGVGGGMQGGAGAPVAVTPVGDAGGMAPPVSPPAQQPSRPSGVTTTVVTVPAGAGVVRPAAAPAVPAAGGVAPLPTPRPVAGVASPGFWLQFGAFGRPEGAESFQKEVGAALDWIAPVLGIFTEGGLHRLQAGPYRSREEAGQVAARVRADSSWMPLVVERR